MLLETTQGREPAGDYSSRRNVTAGLMGNRITLYHTTADKCKRKIALFYNPARGTMS